jgi:nucleotide-binding universal stress UspA family protein
MNEQRPAPVVVGVNGSETALHAVRWATQEARLRGATLRIVHAAAYADGNAPGERHAGSILTRAHTVATRTLPDLPVVTERLGGPVQQALADSGAGAQLLVVGMSGGTRFDDVLLHSTALDVCATAACPVAVVRGHDAAPADGPVVLGLQDVTADAHAVTVAFADAERHGSHLAVVHTVHAGGSERNFHPGHHTVGELESGILDGLGPWRSRHPDVPIDVQVVSGAAAGHLLEASVTGRLLVLGTHARGAAARAVLGSTSRAVLRRSSCPVVVVSRDAVLAESTAPASAASSAPVAGPERWTLGLPGPRPNA